MLSLGWVVELFVAVLMAGVGAGAAQGAPPGASERTLRTSVVVAATAQQVWDAFTTKEGVESWMVPLAEVDFRIGGTLKTNYSKEAGIGGPGTIVHHILAYDPRRMIAMRFEAPDAGDKRLAEACWWMIFLEELGPERTRVSESMAGWGEGPEWDRVYAFFEKGNQWTLDQLVKKFAAPGDAVATTDAMTVLERLVGGHWISENARPDGSVFRARTVLERGPGGNSIVGNGWLGDADGMFHHGVTQVWRDPADGSVRFQNIDQGGTIAAGEIVADGDNALIWDWRTASPGGRRVVYRVRTSLESDDRYRFVIWLRDGSPEDKKLVEVVYTRVAQAPEAFTRLKAPAGEVVR